MILMFGSVQSAYASHSLTLEPATDFNSVGEEHTVTATLSGSFVAGNPVLFTVTGANPTSGTSNVDATGHATFTYTGLNPGNDTITATHSDGLICLVFDPSNPGFCLIYVPDSASGTATKQWGLHNQFPNPILNATYILVNPDTINLSEETNIRLCAGIKQLHVEDIVIRNPAGDSFFDVFAEIDIPSNFCQIWNVPEDFGGLAINMPGTYLVDVNTDDTSFSSEFGVPFFVVPESSIGVVGLVGSSIAALGGFMFWKRKHGNTQPHSIGDLGI